MKKIKFGTTNKYPHLPIPVKQVLPDWYRKLTSELKSLPPHQYDVFAKNKILKACVPFMDAMLNGYVATLSQDVEVMIVNGETQFRWADVPEMVVARSSEATHGLPTPNGYAVSNFAWINQTSIKTPPGYSILITHPLNRFELPFLTMSAIVDSDTTMGEGGVAFFIEKGFEGIIKRGTPIFQIIPIKRDSWSSELNQAISHEGEKNNYLSRTTARAWYKKNVWKRKEFK